MFDQELSKLITTKLKALGFNSSDIPDRFLHSNSFKLTLCSPAIKKDVTIVSSSSLEMTINKSDYLNAILTDFYLGKIRIDKQIEHISEQLNSQSQAAWTLVTTYYACFFLCNDISRISGQFITNFTVNDLNYISSLDSNGNVTLLKTDEPSSFSVSVSHGQMEHEVKLLFKRTGSKVHQVAWNNLSGLIKQLTDLNRKPTASFLLFKNIIKSGPDSQWALPSELRNEWNYSSSKYYDEKGDLDGRKFIHLMKGKNSYSWSSNNTLKPTEENQVAALAYVYQFLKNTYDRVWTQVIDNSK